MKTLKTSGLIIFVAGFFLFNATAFWATYRLSPDAVIEHVSDEGRRDLLLDHAGNILGKTFPSSFAFVSALDNTFEEANKGEIVFDRYAIRDLKYTLTKASAQGPVKRRPALFLFLTFGLCIAGAMLYILPKAKDQPGIKNNSVFFNPMKNTGWLGILTG